MQKPTVIISGKNGQVGSELQHIVKQSPEFHYWFFDKDELDISNNTSLEKVFTEYKPGYFINTAAYTAVDKAETEKDSAFLINAESVGNLAKMCNNFNTKLVHISTDYVFDGTSKQPYKEDDETNPVNYYGYSKLIGEQLALQNNHQTIIIRTSWVYSKYGNNFVKTMLRLMKERTSLNIVNDQFGSPTYAKDLAEVILQIVGQYQISNANCTYGVYHFSNEGIISWYDFACAIRDIKKFNCVINPITTEQYPTPAKRPAYSVLSKEKIKAAFSVNLKNWREGLEECLNELN